MAELSSKDLTLSQMIARVALRTGRVTTTAEGNDLSSAIMAIGLLNQAQMLVGRDNKMARRLLEKANTISSS